jgi:hypothetical protein
MGICAGVMVGLHDAVICCASLPISLCAHACQIMSQWKQSIKVVVNWLDHHPRRWNENFTELAMLALHETWPC